MIGLQISWAVSGFRPLCLFCNISVQTLTPSAREKENFEKENYWKTFGLKMGKNVVWSTGSLARLDLG